MMPIRRLVRNALIPIGAFGLLLLVVLLVKGIETPDQREARMLETQGSPRSLLGEWATCIANGDRKGYLECFTSSSQSLAEHEYAFARAGYDFQTSLIRAYGADAWKEFLAVQRNESSVLLDVPRDERWVETVSIDVNQDEASCMGPTGPMGMIKNDGIWQIDFRPQFASHLNEQTIANVIDMETQSVRKAASHIGAPDYDIRRLDREIGEYFSRMLK